MKQVSLAAMSGFELKGKTTRKRVFLAEMDQVVPWTGLVAHIAPHALAAAGPNGGRPPFAVEAMLRIHFMQQWFGLSDPAMEEALYDTPLPREFAGLDIGAGRLPDESTILRFRGLLEEHGLSQKISDSVAQVLVAHGLLLKAGTAVDAPLIAAPSSTKNASGKRGPEMHQTTNGGQWYFGMKAHIGVDAQSGLAHTHTTTAAIAHDITEAAALLHGAEDEVFADSGYRGAEKRVEVKDKHSAIRWNIAMMPSHRKAPKDKSAASAVLTGALEKMKAGIRAKAEPPLRVLKCQFGYRKVRYRELKKNTAQLQTHFALANLWMVRKRILEEVRA